MYCSGFSYTVYTISDIAGEGSEKKLFSGSGLRFISEGTLGILSIVRGDGGLGTVESFFTETTASLDLNC